MTREARNILTLYLRCVKRIASGPAIRRFAGFRKGYGSCRDPPLQPMPPHRAREAAIISHRIIAAPN
jgi:hypothetical protein